MIYLQASQEIKVPFYERGAHGTVAAGFIFLEEGVLNTCEKLTEHTLKYLDCFDDEAILFVSDLAPFIKAGTLKITES